MQSSAKRSGRPILRPVGGHFSIYRGLGVYGRGVSLHSRQEHITSVVVILPRGADEEFLKIYEELTENVIPMSAKKFEGLDDKDGNSLWRVLMFKAAAEPFKKACREKRFITKDRRFLNGVGANGAGEDQFD